MANNYTPKRRIRRVVRIETAQSREIAGCRLALQSSREPVHDLAKAREVARPRIAAVRERLRCVRIAHVAISFCIAS